MIDVEDLMHRFAHHPPTGDRGDRHDSVRVALYGAARAVNDLAPDGREKSLAITRLEEAMMWANAAIAREPK